MKKVVEDIQGIWKILSAEKKNNASYHSISTECGNE